MGRDEFIFLCMAAGASEIYGVRELPGDLDTAVQELNEKWHGLRDGLTKKKYIKISEDGELLIDNIILYIISACCNPYKIITCSLPDDTGKNNTKIFYINETAAIELESEKNTGGSLVLTPHKSATSVFESILSIYPENTAGESPAAGHSQILIPTNDFSRAIEDIRQNDYASAVDILARYGIQQGLACDMLKGLVENSNIFSVDIYDRYPSGMSLTSSLSVLNREQGCWVFE